MKLAFSTNAYLNFSFPETARRLAALGYTGQLAAALPAWAGVENLEERVDGAAQIDPVVLAALRKAAPDAASSA